ncbi:glyceraldehyde 3-phosphate dehydrogenase [Hasllibacter halocynthiae]|uniref:Glyceraldehyde 3-phosphate dehydrogenase n=1 Tax=Hasllibacter halocynthiae TaxID=595589 RepID=A0A2T0X955_9RHOB|nr:glyceraldehyde 3-phosphate dehydrogenase NAD-binding domain-containing protein [Hasllibacter halocynthiae]PRY95445.1 glyceraldehyde 3-phosphate dehydrogenase [Hasllibacter halocynthiae]
MILLNGFGRIGKLVLRELADRGHAGAIAGVNEVAGDARALAHLMEFDSVQGRWGGDVGTVGDALVLDGHRVPVTAHRRIEDLPLDGVDVAVDCTGMFRTQAQLAPYRGRAGKVVLSAPVKDGGAPEICFGVNHGTYGGEWLVTGASCTTNCLAPVVKVVQEAFGIRHGSYTTIHDVTNTQTIVDAPHKDLRRARSAMHSLIPTSSGSAKAIGRIFPALEGRLDGLAVRVPVTEGSLTDMTFELEREVAVEEVNGVLCEAAAGPLAGILGYEDRPLVSADYTGDRRSAVVDGPLTRVTGGTQAKLFAWYDNEMGYSARLADLVEMVL